MEITIANISQLHFRKTGNNILRKGIKAKIGDIEEVTKEDVGKYGKFMLVHGRSKVYAFAFGETYQQWKKVLRVDKTFRFPAETFSYKPTYQKSSNANCKFDLKFLHGSKPSAEAVRSTNGDCDTSSVQKVSQLLRTSQTFTRKLQSIKVNSGEVYRYLGCKVCNCSIPRQHTDGKYYCKGLCKRKLNNKSRTGVATERKVCFTIRNVELSDDTTQSIESVVIFNSVSELLLRRRGQDFDTDNEAKSAWTELTANNRFDITLKRNKKKKDCDYPPTVFIHSVEKVIAVASSSSTKSDPEPASGVSEYSYDATPDTFEGKKKKRKLPKLLKFDIKLQHTTEQFRDYVTKYPITSKPPGLVLLINNFNFPFKEGEKQRTGSEIDMEWLQEAFCVMGYEIYGNQCHMDIKTRKDFGELINNFHSELRRRDVASFFIVISSHGRNNEIELPGVKKDKICVVEDIMIPFSDQKLPEYQGRPKVFIPITCQNLGNSAVGKSLEFIDNQLFDMLVCCPSLPGYAQLRITTKGSLFVNCLVHNLMHYASKWHLVEILDKVQIDMKKEILRRGLDITTSHYLASTFGHFVLVPAEGDEVNPFQNMEIDSD